MTPKEQAFQMIEGRIDTAQKMLVECAELLYNAAYNEAIEAAANEIEYCNPKEAEEIRRLKK